MIIRGNNHGSYFILIVFAFFALNQPSHRINIDENKCNNNNNINNNIINNINIIDMMVVATNIYKP